MIVIKKSIKNPIKSAEFLGLKVLFTYQLNILKLLIISHLHVYLVVYRFMNELSELWWRVVF